MYQNVVVGTPLVEPWKLLASDKENWEVSEKEKTLFTETRNVAAIMVEAGMVKSIGEVRRNKPQFYVECAGPDMFQIKWGKKFLTIVVGLPTGGTT